MEKTLHSWGLSPAISGKITVPTDERAQLPLPEDGPYLTIGNLRSYSDVCLSSGHLHRRMNACNRVISWDATSGTLRVEAGITIGEILRLTVPQGWFLPVIPGTKHVTIGGAIANDVHGKNHHSAGSFGHHVTRFNLWRSDRGWINVSHETEPALFAATIGGLGLTGIIADVTLTLLPATGPALEVTDQRHDSFAACWQALVASRETHEYAAAWIDCMNDGPAFGRAILSLGRHVPQEGMSPKAQTERAVCRHLPPICLNPVTATLFNRLRYRSRPATKTARVHYEHYFFQLDAVSDWNLLYRPQGLLQYQSVLDPEGLPVLLEAIRECRERPYLVTLKHLGNLSSKGMLSWPKAGGCLAFDFRRTPITEALCRRLDAITLAYNGRIYPAKDPRIDRETFAPMYPQLQAFSRYIDPQCTSDFWQRICPNHL